jgi:hypothetical protein
LGAQRVAGRGLVLAGGRYLRRGWPLMLAVARATTGPYQMDRMDDVPDATARKRFIGIYLDVSQHLFLPR